MKQWEYEALKTLSPRNRKQPYGRTGNFKREDGYKEGILAAKVFFTAFISGSLKVGGITMQLAEKRELVRLLNLYQADLLMDNDHNIREAAKHSVRNGR